MQARSRLSPPIFHELIDLVGQLRQSHEIIPAGSASAPHVHSSTSTSHSQLQAQILLTERAKVLFGQENKDLFKCFQNIVRNIQTE